LQCPSGASGLEERGAEIDPAQVWLNSLASRKNLAPRKNPDCQRALFARALSFIALSALALNFAQPMIERWRRRRAQGAD